MYGSPVLSSVSVTPPCQTSAQRDHLLPKTISFAVNVYSFDDCANIYHMNENVDVIVCFCLF